MSPRPLFALISLILIAGACLLILLTVLAGAVDANPVNKIYFLEAATSGISGAPPVSRWTLWNVCDIAPTGLNMCPGVRAAFPLDPPRNFGTDQGVPPTFLGTKKFFYLTRFMFAFVFISLFFAVSALFLGIFALCSRIGSYLSSLTCSVALFFQTLTACLMTAAYVIGRNNFIGNQQTASLGRYAFGFMWAAMACLFLATALLCLAGVTSKKSDKTYSKKTGGKSFFGRKKSTRDRGSFIDSESQRRVVKDEFS
ncbi:hypothetical protein MMC24_003596 [Lignoscripta atroalba]|nr:hypothetical protein [Lignoscripta atroalba]